MYTHIWSQIDGSGQLSSRGLARGSRNNTLKASTDTFKVIETIDDRVGGYNFLPALILSGPRRRQCPLYSVNSESSLLGCAGNDRYSKDWSPSFLKARQHKPNDSARVGTGQSSRRGRVRCLTHFIAWERRRCEPGSNSVIVTASFTGCEGHVAGPGGLQRTRKIFVGCPAIRPIWDQSPGIRNRPGLRLLVTGSIHYTIKIASAVSRRRRKSKIVHAQRPDQIPPRAFHASPTPPQPNQSIESNRNGRRGAIFQRPTSCGCRRIPLRRLARWLERRPCRW